MKETLLQKWCDQAWLYLIYLLGIAMGSLFLIKWSVWDIPQIFMCLLAIMIPLHVFEENTLPGGFFYMNNLGRKSDKPLAYPQSRLTNMITNLGAEVYVIVLTVFAAQLGAASVIAAIIFGIGELIHHTRDGVNMYNRYKSKGKTTIYGPGTITSYVCLLPLSVYGCYWLSEHAFDVKDVLVGVGIMLFIIVFLLLIPLGISGKVKSTRYAFTSAGYFDKYEK
ncbi:MAG: HXXEE domain-containing protein [Candidatus Pelethousia sp.]|nr:HXXEE domain-containing protein [Candidatus Pelethousia sp.]